MAYKTTITITFLCLLSVTQCQRQRVARNPLAAALQNILSPNNAEVLKMLKLAGARNVNYPCAQESRPVIKNFPQPKVDNRQLQRVVEKVIPYPVVQEKIPYPVSQEKLYVSAPCQSPQPLVNPYLPAASPVSAIAPPTSNLLPPAEIGRSRCNFLRKIPIPPPCL